MCFWHEFKSMCCCQSGRHECVCVCFAESKCVRCNPSQSGTTQQPVQRPVCIITACAAARYRQTRLRALSYKTQTSHPIAETPVVQPSPALWFRNGQTNACVDKLPGMRRSLLESSKEGMQIQITAKSSVHPLFRAFRDLWKKIGHLSHFYWISSERAPSFLTAVCFCSVIKGVSMMHSFVSKWCCLFL